jgi:hypothetical protein
MDSCMGMDRRDAVLPDPSTEPISDRNYGLFSSFGLRNGLI